MPAPQLTRSLALPGLVLVLAGLAALYGVAAEMLLRQQRAATRAWVSAEATRVAAQVVGRWDALAREQPCLPAEPNLVAVWQADGTARCRVGFERSDQPALTAPVRAALAGRHTGTQWEQGDARRGTVEVLAQVVPVRRNGAVIGAVATARVVPAPGAALSTVRGAFLAAALGLGGLLWLIAWRRATRFRGELRHVRGGIDRLARGEPLPPAFGVEAEALRPLTTGLHELAARQHDRLERLAQQLEQREAVLRSMAEGVLAVQRDGRLIDLNTEAARMFGVEPATVRGRDLLEVVRNPELQQFVRDALGAHGSVERELTLYGEELRLIQARGTLLRDAMGQGLGVLVVLNDVTRLRRLESMRRDFVANVSHELKTPITSIKGYVETLLDGAMDEPEQARHFLQVVARHAERLHTLTEDLLNLSRIEDEAESGALHREEAQLAAVLDAAVQVCAAKAEDKEIRIHLACPPEARAALNPPLVEQAVVNLVDNAVKYAPRQTEVWVEGTVEGQDAGRAAVIRVRDQGPGIPAEHLPRLFERFYRVDKARSRKAGGTGLGLAIVKHIAQAHGGRVGVESRSGQGSVFHLHLPAAD